MRSINAVGVVVAVFVGGLSGCGAPPTEGEPVDEVSSALFVTHTVYPFAQAVGMVEGPIADWDAHVGRDRDCRTTKSGHFGCVDNITPTSNGYLSNKALPASLALPDREYMVFHGLASRSDFASIKSIAILDISVLGYTLSGGGCLALGFYYNNQAHIYDSAFYDGNYLCFSTTPSWQTMSFMFNPQTFGPWTVQDFATDFWAYFANGDFGGFGAPPPPSNGVNITNVVQQFKIAVTFSK